MSAAHDPLALPRSVEERGVNAWPALETMVVDGWILRFAAGYTKRANSTNAWIPRIPVMAIADIAAPLYAAVGLPLIIRLSPLAGPDADVQLSDAGFRALDDSIVMIAPIAGEEIDHSVALQRRPDRAWSNGFAEANYVSAAHRTTHDAMLERIRLPVACATAFDGEHPLGFGLAVAERGMIGLFDIVTIPSARRQGTGRRIVTSLMAWGRSQGAGQAYLQVLAANFAAISLYRQLGFTEAYRYHYRMAPL